MYLCSKRLGVLSEVDLNISIWFVTVWSLGFLGVEEANARIGDIAHTKRNHNATTISKCCASRLGLPWRLLRAVTYLQSKNTGNAMYNVNCKTNVIV